MASGVRNLEQGNNINYSRRFLIILGILAIVIFGAFCIDYYNNKYGSFYNYVPKKVLIKELVPLVENGADVESFQQAVLSLSDYKQVKDSVRMHYNSYFRTFSIDDEGVRTVVTLDKVLRFLKNEHLKSVPLLMNDPFLKRIDSLISDNNYLNPFASLDKNQSYYLKNVKDNLGGNYSLISSDIENVVDELIEKNKIQDEYLLKARLSYRNSIIAMSIASVSFLLSVVFSIRNSKKNQRVIESLSELIEIHKLDNIKSE